MDIMDYKRKKIYQTFENPNLTKEEKMDKVAKILCKTDEELKDEQQNENKVTLIEMYRSLFQKEGEENENKHIK